MSKTQGDSNFIYTKLLVDCIFRNKCSNTNPFLLSLASKNRVLLQFAEKCQNKAIVEVGNKWRKSLKETLIFIKDVLRDDAHFLITRTYKYIPYVTFDVDLYIRKENFSKVIEKFQESGCIAKSHDHSLGGRIPKTQVNIIKFPYLTIDLHNDFTWEKMKYLDSDLLLLNIRNQKIEGIDVPIPSAEVEFLLCMADISHERFSITLLDLIWIMGLSKEIKDWEMIFAQAKKYGWNGTFLDTARIINGMMLSMVGKEIIPAVGCKSGNYNLPYFLPLSISYRSYLENFIKNGRFPITSFTYMHYSLIRYYLSGKKKMPFYDDWCT